MTTAEQFMAAAPAPLSGNTSWASQYAATLRRVVHEHAARSPRSLQAHLGPSELGTPCDRQVVGKLIGEPVTNHVADPWPSVVGTATHAWLADAFQGDNTRHGLRWMTEQRVIPHPAHAGTADLYDATERAVIDHKILGPTSLAKVQRPEGPPAKYVIQLLLYAHGYRALGLPVDRVVIAAYPRTRSSLYELYVWERRYQPGQDEAIVQGVLDMTERRKRLAWDVQQGAHSITDIETTPSDDDCYFCPYYRPQTAADGGPGCPGPRTGNYN